MSPVEKIEEDEFDEEEHNEGILDDVENNVGSSLDKAQMFIEDFQKSKFEIQPSTKGHLFAQGNLQKKQLLRFFNLLPNLGIIVKFDSQDAFEKFESKKTSVLSLNKKALIKSKIEIIYLKKIVSLNHSFRDEFTKSNQHCLELYYENDKILYLACYDSH